MLDSLQNCILVCSLYNGAMEADADVARQARDNGHKLSKFMSPVAPVFDLWARKWYVLDEKGNKYESEPPQYLI